MQGRLSPPVRGQIQAFPWRHWESEFSIAQKVGFGVIEWTLDAEQLYDNPLMTSEGQGLIGAQVRRSGVSVVSLTGDCFMQRPFWKVGDSERGVRERNLLAVAEACHRVGISLIVVPLVDDGSIESRRQEDVLVEAFERHADAFNDLGLRVAFESDYCPTDLLGLVDRLDPAVFGINYDIGNSASLGYSHEEELLTYGSRVINVHVKDRRLGGPSVPLGEGCADFDTVFGHLARLGYRGNFILQTARSASGDHVGALCRYREMTMSWIDRHGV